MFRQKNKYILSGILAILLSISSVSVASAVFQPLPVTPSQPTNNSVSGGNLGNTDPNATQPSPTGSVSGGDLEGGSDPTATKDPKGSTNIIVTNYIDPAIKFLSIGFGLIVVIMIMIGGVQYTTAGSNPQAIAAARKRIGNALFALILFTFMFALLQWLIPGGIF